MHVLSLSCWALVLALLGLGCARPTDSASTRPVRKVTLQTDWFPQAEHGGFYQALAKGFYLDAGLTVELVPGGPGAGINLRVAKGQADFGMNRSDDLILAASQGLPVLIVAAVLQHDSQVLLVHAASPVRKLEDIAGRTVTASIGMAWIPWLKQSRGIEFDLRPQTYGLAGFFTDPDAIQQGLVTNEPYVARAQGVAVRTIPIGASGFDAYHTIFCRRELARMEPEVVRAFVAASIRGWRDYLEGDPAPAHALILQRNTQMTPGFLAYSRGEMIERALVRGDAAQGENIGQIDLQRINDQIEKLYQLKILRELLPVEMVATKEFLPIQGR
ncbi:MAG: ABC transporter substrate-binding protein [Opitutaceae bacterium]|jgi:NitT/TauT family transport system substrate-binding protein